MTIFYPYSKEKRIYCWKRFPSFLITFLISQYILAQSSPPAITSFAPTSGPIGAIVTISGSNFNTSKDSNIVYIGGLKANVSAATSTTIIVTVPIGTTSGLIAITSNGLTTYSSQRFSILFPGIGKIFTSNSLGSFKNFAAEETPEGAVIGDLDGDGRNDMVVANYFADIVSVFRNIGTNGTISFAAKLNISMPQRPGNLCIVDLNGDGKLDIAVACENYVSILMNTSTSGNITFSPRMDLFLPSIIDIATGDMNGDGKPDLVLTTVGAISVFRNTGSMGLMSFDNPINYSTHTDFRRILISDIDGDGKSDIVLTWTTQSRSSGGISVLRNISTDGASFTSNSFEQQVNYTGGANTYGLAIGDLDGDGKLDIVATNIYSDNISIFRNKSAPGTITLATKIDYSTGSNPYDVCITDLDGDGKTDLAVGNYSSETVTVLKNNGSIGTISFAAKVDYEAYDELLGICTGDLDGDGKPDLAAANYSGYKLWTIRNTCGEPKIVPSEPNPVSGNIVNKLTIDGSVHTYLGHPYVQRHYDILPAINPLIATATVTLYFTQQEFDNFNAYPDHGPDLPKNSDDNSGKGNLRVYQYHGFSTSGLPGTYSGTGIEINPVDDSIVWNSDAQWWAVTFAVNGFSGFFLSTTGFISNAVLAPTIDTSGNTTFCQGGNVLLTSSAASDNQWYKDGSVISAATSKSYLATVSGSYTVTVTSNGIPSPLSAGVVVVVKPIPPKPIVSRDGATLLSSSMTGNQWYRDGVPISGATSQLYRPTEVANYTVSVTTNGCSSLEADKYYFAITGVVNIDNTHFIRLSPNPAKDQMLLNFKVDGLETLNVRIIDLQGKSYTMLENLTNNSRVNISNLATGIYIARIYSSDRKHAYFIEFMKW